MNGSLRLALIVVALTTPGCVPAHHTPLSVARFDDTLVYYGDLSSAGLAELEANDHGTARTLLIRSGGGSVTVGMDFGDWVFARHLDVVVDEACLSSCANYIFPAGRTKTILPGGLVAWHGNDLQPAAEDEIETLPRSRRPEARALLAAWRAREAAFYAKLGVNECLDRFGIDVLGRHGLFTMGAADMARFGVTDVHGAPASKDQISTRIRDEIDFEFITVPSALTGCGREPPSASALAGARKTDANRAEAERILSALAAGDASGAERRFSARMRTELPPSVLDVTWRSLVAQSGAFQSFSIVSKDHDFGKERYKLSVSFAARTLLALIVFEPTTGEVVGLFFSLPVAERPGTTAPGVGRRAEKEAVPRAPSVAPIVQGVSAAWTSSQIEHSSETSRQETP